MMAEAKPKATKKPTKAAKEAELIVEAAPEKVIPSEAITDNSQATDGENAVAETKPVKSTAKAGKRSAKAIKEAEEKEAKEERKAQAETTESEAAKPKKVNKP